MRENGPRVILEEQQVKDKTQGHELQQEKLRLHMRRKYSSIEVFRCWDRAPERMWDFHPWRHSKFDRNKVLSNLTYLNLF